MILVRKISGGTFRASWGSAKRGQVVMVPEDVLTRYPGHFEEAFPALDIDEAPAKATSAKAPTKTAAKPAAKKPAKK